MQPQTRLSPLCGGGFAHTESCEQNKHIHKRTTLSDKEEIRPESPFLFGFSSFLGPYRPWWLWLIPGVKLITPQIPHRSIWNVKIKSDAIYLQKRYTESIIAFNDNHNLIHFLYRETSHTGREKSDLKIVLATLSFYSSQMSGLLLARELPWTTGRATLKKLTIIFGTCPSTLISIFIPTCFSFMNNTSFPLKIQVGHCHQFAFLPRSMSFTLYFSQQFSDPITSVYSAQSMAVTMC